MPSTGSDQPWGNLVGIFPAWVSSRRATFPGIFSSLHLCLRNRGISAVVYCPSAAQYLLKPVDNPQRRLYLCNLDGSICYVHTQSSRDVGILLCTCWMQELSVTNGPGLATVPDNGSPGGNVTLYRRGRSLEPIGALSRRRQSHLFSSIHPRNQVCNIPQLVTEAFENVGL